MRASKAVTAQDARGVNGKWGYYRLAPTSSGSSFLSWANYFRTMNLVCAANTTCNTRATREVALAATTKQAYVNATAKASADAVAAAAKVKADCDANATCVETRAQTAKAIADKDAKVCPNIVSTTTANFKTFATKITQVVKSTAVATASAYTGDTRLVYNFGYVSMLGLTDGPNMKPGTTVVSTPINARRSGVNIKFEATVSYIHATQAAAKAQAAAADPSLLVSGITRAKTALNKPAVVAPTTAQLTVGVAVTSTGPASTPTPTLAVVASSDSKLTLIIIIVVVAVVVGLVVAAGLCYMMTSAPATDQQKPGVVTADAKIGVEMKNTTPRMDTSVSAPGSEAGTATATATATPTGTGTGAIPQEIHDVEKGAAQSQSSDGVYPDSRDCC